LITLIKAANIEVEPIYATIFEKALAGKNVSDLIANVGSGAPAAAPVAAAATSSSDKKEEKKEEKKKEEPKEESDEDMGFGLFD
jgi:large subunit ribosomal protein LP1